MAALPAPIVPNVALVMFIYLPAWDGGLWFFVEKLTLKSSVVQLYHKVDTKWTENLEEPHTKVRSLGKVLPNCSPFVS